VKKRRKKFLWWLFLRIILHYQPVAAFSFLLQRGQVVVDGRQKKRGTNAKELPTYLPLEFIKGGSR
jgi:hypothetical protein